MKYLFEDDNFYEFNEFCLSNNSDVLEMQIQQQSAK